mgnify:CR=1 FL=1
MSRIGKAPISIPQGVTITIKDNIITVKGKLGELTQVVKDVAVKQEDGKLIVESLSNTKQGNAFHGLYRALLHNMVVGVTEGYEKVLEVNGVGYRAAKQGNKLVLSLGYSHPVEMEDPEGITSVLDGQNIIKIQGIDKERVGQYAAEIRDKRRPEPYKGKGIKYATETIRRKVGKTSKK